MNILVAKNIGECARWNGTAVVVDVLYSSSTLCALLYKSKKRIVVVCPEVETTGSLLKEHPHLMVLSDQQIPFPHEEDSPCVAETLASRQPVLLFSAEMGKALQALQYASPVLLGGFCNFDVTAQTVAAQGKDVLLVPSSLFGGREDDEDILCAQAFKEFLQGTGAPDEILGDFAHTIRWMEFSQNHPRDVKKNFKLSFTLDKMPVVPQVALSKQGHWAVCFPYGEKPAVGGITLPNSSHSSVVAQPSLETMPDISLRLMLEHTVRMDKLQPKPNSHTLQPSSQEKAGTLDMLPLGEDPVPESKSTPVTSSEQESSGGGWKKFFSNIIRTVKEEKEELSQSLQEVAGEPVPTSTPHVADPMEAVLENSPQPKQSIQLSSEPDSKKEVPVPSSHKAKKAIVLFSGGLDSTTCLYWAISQGYTCEALTVSYGQRHLREIVSAQAITRRLGVKHHVIDLNLPWLTTSSLVDESKPLPDIAVEKIPQAGVPSTYVPGRNLMFLSIAGSLLDAVQADAIIAGPNAVDFSGYPDCTPAFYKAAGEALNRGTTRGVREGIEVLAPLMEMSKADIVRLAYRLKVPFELTWSCYAGGERPCGKCDSCKLRAKGFEEAGVHDTALD